MEDFIFAPIVLMIGLGVHAAVLRASERRDHRLLNLAFAAHILSGITQVLLVKYYFKGGGDMLVYYYYGVEAAEVVRTDFTLFAPELVRALLQLEFELPVPLFGGGSTQSMSAAAAILLFLTGNSLYATVLAIAVAAYLSQVLLYRALRPEFPPEHNEALLWGTNLLPSAVFWSSALLKEPLVMVAIGPLVLGLRWFSEGSRRLAAVLLVVLSAGLIATMKPYVLMAMSLAAAAYYLLRRLRSNAAAELKPFAVITAILLAGGGLVLGNKFFAKADAKSTTSAFASQRAVGYTAEGGSNFQLESGPPEDIETRGVGQELLLAPFALFTALFRPLLFEARNAVQLANAIEATVLLVIFLQLVRRMRWRAIAQRVLASPALLFCTVFALALAVGTGLSTTNMGTLSRYRAPMMPFFFTVLMVLRHELLNRSRRQGGLLSPAAAAR